MSQNILLGHTENISNDFLASEMKRLGPLRGIESAIKRQSQFTPEFVGMPVDIIGINSQGVRCSSTPCKCDIDKVLSR
jgi:hypothetical protein